MTFLVYCFFSDFHYHLYDFHVHQTSFTYFTCRVLESLVVPFYQKEVCILGL